MKCLIVRTTHVFCILIRVDGRSSKAIYFQCVKFFSFHRWCNPYGRRERVLRCVPVSGRLVVCGARGAAIFETIDAKPR